MKTSEVLRAAAKRVAEPEGWCQRNFFGWDGRVCALGAIHVQVKDDNPAFDRAVGFLCEAIQSPLPLRERVADLNDTGPPEYAHPRVLQMYARAIELAEVEEQASGLSGSHESSGSLPSPLAVEPGNTGSASEGARIAGSRKVMA